MDKVILAGSAVSAAGVIVTAVFSFCQWLLKQNNQDKEIEAIKEENTLICYALRACLDGLIQLGCNHTVPDAKERLDKHLNQKAHK